MTAHAVRASDPDKTACNLRLSHKEGRTAATLPLDIECDTCALAVLRAWQRAHPGPDSSELVSSNTWPEGFGPSKDP